MSVRGRRPGASALRGCRSVRLLLPLLTLACLLRQAQAGGPKPPRIPSGASSRACPSAAAEHEALSGRWTARSKVLRFNVTGVSLSASWHPHRHTTEGGAQAPSTCAPFKDVPLFASPFERLFNLPKTLGGPGFHEGVIPPVDLSEVITKGDTSQLRLSLGTVPEKYWMPPCKNSAFRQGTVFVEEGQVGPVDSGAALRRLMSALAGRHVLMLGDSVMRQLGMALVCAWRKEGFVPSNATFGTDGDVSLTYANGLILSRWTLDTVTTWYHEHLEEVFAIADVVVANIGRHYSFAGGRTHYEKGVDVMAGSLAKVMGGRGLLLETLPAHFPTPSGDFTDPRAKSTGRTKKTYGYACKPYRDEAGANWQNTELRKAADKYGVQVVRYAQVLAKRHDAHVGFRRNTGRKDCLHWCFAEELFSPLLSAILGGVQRALECPEPLREFEHDARWKSLAAALTRQATPDNPAT